MKIKTRQRIDSFNFESDRLLARKYQIIAKLGTGWEGEVYRVRELNTGIERAAKFFFPQRNLHNRATKFYAKKLHKLRHCKILIQYHTQERIIYHRIPTIFLVSEYVEGELLNQFVAHQAGKRLTPFEGLHLLHALASGVEEIHQAHEYHGDLHDDNVIVRRRGLSFDVKLVDMYNWGKPDAENIRDDVCNLIRIFYDSIGGARFYAKHPREIKDICCGLKRSLIIRKFRTAGHLRQYLETMRWHTGY
ncbi:serine/threonine protein kinase [candidate division TA06 bacterium DG_78]|uniref:Serine/threonine protein kinase n=1 Tax=candidate division TA06 bacterium DG_78 TaxID=1703772 RepID=A0A0S7YHR6_UNCT6|nr:MAG: serine/threonine protein kinase [candidate division TA06 bacterium DG_78]